MGVLISLGVLIILKFKGSVASKMSNVYFSSIREWWISDLTVINEHLGCAHVSVLAFIGISE